MQSSQREVGLLGVASGLEGRKYCPRVISWVDENRRRALNSASGNSMTYEGRIVWDIQICGGEPVFNGTRVTLRTVLATLAAGDTAEEILAGFRSLKPEDIRAAIAFAAASAEEDLPVPAVPQIR
jgi:uncharacterized protein (DUF433 family)